MNYAIIVAAGKSERMGQNVDKAFLSLGAKPVVVYSLMAFEKCADIDEVVLVVRSERAEAARCMVQMFGCTKVKKIVSGGTQRQISVAKGLEEIPDDGVIVVIHDGARPCVTPELITATVRSAREHGSGIAAVKITDTVKEVQKGFFIAKTVDRTKLWAVQTPQAFQRALLVKAMAQLHKSKKIVTDDSAAMELVTKNIRLVTSTSANIKITSPDDLVLAAALMRL